MITFTSPTFPRWYRTTIDWERLLMTDPLLVTIVKCSGQRMASADEQTTVLRALTRPVPSFTCPCCNGHHVKWACCVCDCKGAIGIPP